MAAAIPRHLLETLVNCPACSQRYTEPKVLPSCGHTICTTCLEHEWTEGHDQTPPLHHCPVKNCRKEICSSIVRHQDLPVNQTIVDLIESCNFHVEATGPCQSCHRSPSFVKCSHCCLFVCFECANQHRRETLTTLTNHINTLEQAYLTMNDQIDHARTKFSGVREKSLDAVRLHYARLIDELREAQKSREEVIERQSNQCLSQLEAVIDDHRQHCEQIHCTIQELRTTITDWSTVEQFKQLQANLTQIEEKIQQANEHFHQRLPDMKLFGIDPVEQTEKTHVDDSPSQTNELALMNSKQNLAASTGSTTRHAHQHHHPLDDSSSTASSSTNNDPIKISPSTNNRARKKHANNGQPNHYKSLNTVVHQPHSSVSSIGNDHPHSHAFLDDDQQQHHQVKPTTSSPGPGLATHQRSQPAITGNALSKTISSSIADLSLSTHMSKISSNTIRLTSTFQSKLDNCSIESYKKIPLSQSFDWGILAITNTDMILLYNKDKSSLVIFDAQGHENERIQWSDGDIKDLCIYHTDSIIIIGEHKQASKPVECKLYVCNLTRKQLERERVVERGLNCQRVASDEQLIFYASEKGCNKSKVSVFDHELQLQVTFESGVEIRSLAVDSQCCYLLGKRREREPGRYFLEKRQKNGQLVRRIDLYELNPDNMNRLAIDPISRGVIVTDGGNKKIWAIGPEGEKKAIQYRPWPWSVGFLTTDTLLILHAGCLTFHAVHHAKQLTNGTKIRTVIPNCGKV